MLAGRVPAEMISAISNWAEANGVTRSEAIRRLIQKGLDATSSDYSEG